MQTTKKKRFGISQNLTQGLSETINAVENHAGVARFEVVALSRIETDPENPRDLILDIEDLKHGYYKEHKDKQKEYEGLQSLAETIRRKGVMNPIVVYKHGEKYRLVAGERRFLASFIAGKEDIQAKILGEKPKPYDLRLLQWIENTERSDLSLKERIGNVKVIMNEFIKEKGDVELTATLLKDTIGISLQQAYNYLSIIRAPRDIDIHIQSGNLNNIEKAAYLAQLDSLEVRTKALDACLNGSSLKQIKTLVENESNIVVKPNSIKLSPKSGRSATRVNMGITSKTSVAQKIIQSIITGQQYQRHSKTFENTNWNDYSDVSKAFRRLISILEKEVG